MAIRDLREHLRGLARILSCGFFLSFHASVFASVYQGDSLDEPLTLVPDFSTHESLILTVNQRLADLTISIVNDGPNGLTKRFGFSAKKSLPELLIVERTNCNNCSIKISGAKFIDDQSPYRFTLIPLNVTKQKDANETKRALRHLNSAAQSQLQADEAKNTADRKAALARVIEELGHALVFEVAIDGIDWQPHLLLLRAEAMYALGDRDGHKTSLEKIIALSENRDSRYAALALYELGPLLKAADEQAGMYRKGIQIAERLEDDLIKAIGANFLAVSLVKNKNAAEARSLLQFSYETFSQQLSWRRLMDPLYNLAWAEQRFGNYPRALAYATQHKLLSEKYGDEENVVWALYSMALTYGQIGERFQAEKFIDEGLKRLEAFPTHTRSSRYILSAYLLEHRTKLLMEFGSNVLARRYLAELKAAYSEQGWPGHVAETMVLEADLALKMNDVTTAEKILTEALAYESTNNRNRQKITVLIRMAELELREEQYLLAMERITEALQELSKTVDPILLSKALVKTVKTLEASGAYLDAQQVAERASSTLAKYGLPEDRATFAYLESQILSALGRKDLALLKLEQAQLIVEETLPRVKRVDLRQEYLALHRQIFEASANLILAIDPNRTLDALAQAEALKARTLLERIRSFSKYQVASPAVSASRAKLHNEILFNAAHWYSDSESGKGDALFRIAELSEQLAKIEASASSNTISSDEQKEDESLDYAVSSNELIAYYFLADKQSLLWVLSSKGISSYSLPSKTSISSLVESVMENVAIPPSARNQNSHWAQQNALLELSDAVLSPLTEHLSDTSIDHITIIPDEALNQVPFGALLLASNKAPLLSRYSISYAQSLASRQAIEERKQLRDLPTTNSALIVADTTNSKDDRLLEQRLPFSKLEAIAIQQLLNGEAVALMDEEAIKSNVIVELNKPHSILHFAAHGFLNNEEPALSGLMLSSSDSDQGMLMAPEISGLQLSADTVVLSACETSLGKHISGEGYLSLNRAFLEAGANKVIGSLWKVEDRAMSEIMEAFYSGFINHSLSTAKALQAAQYKIFSSPENDWSDPYYWAGLQLQGGSEAL